MTESFKKNMSAVADELGVSLSDEQINKLFIYYEMLIEKNKVMNLTGITEEYDVITKHFADSLSIVKALDISELISKTNRVKLIDVGTGAGFPGMVLKIAFPALNITLFDSLNKRLIFLDEVINKLSLDNIKTVHGRAEDFGHNKEYREKFDIATSRAVANMSTLLEYCLPFLKTDGKFAAYKSADSDAEIISAEVALNILGGKIVNEKKFILPGTDIERCIITIDKSKKTPNKYPRRAGLPSSNPLK